MSNADEPPDELARRRKQRDGRSSSESAPRPKTKTDSERDASGRGRPPPKTAVGYSGDWGSRFPYRAGQNVICKVVRAEPGGYEVVIIKDKLPAFLPTPAILEPGQDVMAQFVCVYNKRALVAVRFSSDLSRPSISDTQVRLQEQLDQIDSGDLRLKRATDLFLSPVESDACENFAISERGLESLIGVIESDRVTGCVKASSEERRSRAAMLLYRGRVVGCVHVCRSMPETLNTEQSLQRVLADLELPQTAVTKYDLPEDITLAMSALFLGYPVQRNDDYEARAYMDYICNWFEGKEQTACLAFSLPSSARTCLGFVYKGKFCGAFYVDDQKLTRDREFLYDLLRREPDAIVEASILPPEMLSSAVRFGYSLNQAMRRHFENDD